MKCHRAGARFAGENFSGSGAAIALE